MTYHYDKSNYVVVVRNEMKKNLRKTDRRHKKHPKNVKILFLLSLSHVCHRVITNQRHLELISKKKKLFDSFLLG